MSYTTAYTLWCDTQAPEGCIAWISPENKNLGDARMTAKAFGWQFTGGKDLCARHKAKPEPSHDIDGCRLRNVRQLSVHRSRPDELATFGDCSYCGQPTHTDHIVDASNS